ncbi:MAG: hypothetical protein EOM51_10220 [Clostridia bacterium]|nr:hypothetical protein [Clostridia bacterium]
MGIIETICYLHKEGIFVSVVNAILVHDYSANTLRRCKTDRKDAIKLANYAIDRWIDLTEYIPADDIRQMLKSYNRQYNQYIKLKVILKNNLISMFDQSFPGVNTLFSSAPRRDGHKKWVDFAEKFWHCECVCGISKSAFKERFSHGVKKLDITIALIKRRLFIMRPVVMLTLFRRTTIRNCSSRRPLNSSTLWLKLSQSSLPRCNVYLPCFPNMLSSWQCMELEIFSVLSLWPKLAMCAASIARKLSLPLLDLMPHRISPVLMKLKAEVSPNVVHPR